MEGYGEDVYTNAVFCAASVKGYQGDDLSHPDAIAACLKHYVGYGASFAAIAHAWRANSGFHEHA